MINVPTIRVTMLRSKQARLSSDPYTLTARLPADLGEWLRTYARQREVSMNVAMIEAIKLLKASQEETAGR